MDEENAGEMQPEEPDPEPGVNVDVKQGKCRAQYVGLTRQSLNERHETYRTEFRGGMKEDDNETRRLVENHFLKKPGHIYKVSILCVVPEDADEKEAEDYETWWIRELSTHWSHGPVWDPVLGWLGLNVDFKGFWRPKRWANASWLPDGSHSIIKNVKKIRG